MEPASQLETLVKGCLLYMNKQFSVFSLVCFGSNVSNTRDSVSSGYPNTENRVENTTHSGLFSTKFKVFPSERCFECLIYLLN